MSKTFFFFCYRHTSMRLTADIVRLNQTCGAQRERRKREKERERERERERRECMYWQKKSRVAPQGMGDNVILSHVQFYPNPLCGAARFFLGKFFRSNVVAVTKYFNQHACNRNPVTSRRSPLASNVRTIYTTSCGFHCRRTIGHTKWRPAQLGNDIPTIVSTEACDSVHASVT
jgi:hypothetical protein